jgi:hypothetical protein
MARSYNKLCVLCVFALDVHDYMFFNKLRGSLLSSPVLAQWIKRYGEPAREIIGHHGQYTAGLDAD